MEKIAKVRRVLEDNKNKIIAAGVVAASGAGVASAQTGTTASQIDYTGMIGSVQNGMVTVVSGAGPALFGFVAVIGGFYFVWGRIRSLW